MIHTYRIAILFVLLVAALALSACGGAAGTTIADVIEQAGGQVSGEDGAQSSAGPLDQAQATVTARSLRVRGEPSPAGEVVGGIKEGEVYDVIGLSSDGEWIQLAVPAIVGGSGWVSANFVEVQGSITEAAVTAVTAPPAVTSPPAAGGATPAAASEGLNLLAAGPGTAIVTTEGVRLRVRAEPSADAEIVGYVYEGELYTVVGTSADGLWTQIGGRPGTDNVNGGWVASEFLTLN